MERRLAAILAADVVGYSRLMEADEVGALGALKGHRDELINPRIADHHGSIVKLMGDGALVEFASVVDAVECALAIQRRMAVRNAEVSPATRPLGASHRLGDASPPDTTSWNFTTGIRSQDSIGGLPQRSPPTGLFADIRG